MGQSILPAFFAIAIHTIGVLGKLFSEVIENIDEGPIEGLTSLGSSWPQKIIYGVFPQVFPAQFFLLEFFQIPASLVPDR